MKADRLRVALLQTASVPDCPVNLARLGEQLSSVPGAVDLAVLPENVLCLGNNRSVRAAARREPDWLRPLSELARVAGCAVVFGGVPVCRGQGITNTSLVLAGTGELLARYDKIHLFQLDPGTESAIDETRFYQAGVSPVAFDLHGWRIGLTICYDLRFPELYRCYAGADLMLCTAAFTAETGRAHWHVLMRARAVENQCYVVGVGQCGTNADTGVGMFGHSVAVDPWGRVLCDAGHEAGMTTVDLTASATAEVRQRLPALANRRI